MCIQEQLFTTSEVIGSVLVEAWERGFSHLMQSACFQKLISQHVGNARKARGLQSLMA